jgi:hypothetical protein
MVGLTKKNLFWGKSKVVIRSSVARADGSDASRRAPYFSKKKDMNVA